MMRHSVWAAFELRWQSFTLLLYKWNILNHFLRCWKDYRFSNGFELKQRTAFYFLMGEVTATVLASSSFKTRHSKARTLSAYVAWHHLEGSNLITKIIIYPNHFSVSTVFLSMPIFFFQENAFSVLLVIIIIFAHFQAQAVEFFEGYKELFFSLSLSLYCPDIFQVCHIL